MRGDGLCKGSVLIVVGADEVLGEIWLLMILRYVYGGGQIRERLCIIQPRFVLCGVMDGEG